MIFHLLLSAFTFLVPNVYADYGLVNNVVNSVGGSLPFLTEGGFCSGGGACGFVEIAGNAMLAFRPILTIAGVFVIALAGYKMIVGQEDDALTKARATLSATVAGLVMAYLIEPFISAFYGSQGEVARGEMEAGAEVAITEIGGLIDWVLVLVAALCILMLVISALRSLGKSASEEGVSGIRNTIFSIVAGIILLVFRFVFSELFIENTHDPIPMLEPVVIVISYLLGFVALVAVIIVIYAGLLYVLSLGKEDSAEKGKALLIRASIGVILALLSLAIVNFVVYPVVSY